MENEFIEWLPSKSFKFSKNATIFIFYILKNYMSWNKKAPVIMLAKIFIHVKNPVASLPWSAGYTSCHLLVLAVTVQCINIILWFA